MMQESLIPATVQFCNATAFENIGDVPECRYPDCHLSSPESRKADTIKPGAVVVDVGTTGLRTARPKAVF